MAGGDDPARQGPAAKTVLIYINLPEKLTVKDTDVIIVGAGPAGSSCAGLLKQYGVDTLLLDKKVFPRDKVCAGWLTPDVFRVLSLQPEDYPYGLKRFEQFVVHLRRRSWRLPVHQYAIRRLEFDNWLLEHFALSPIRHEVKEIVYKDDRFIVDNRYRSKALVGTGGDRCPVARTYFKTERLQQMVKRVVAMETELEYPVRDPRCHLWFRQKGLPGYAWYVPKADGYLNLGIGAFSEKLLRSGGLLKERWQIFLDQLKRYGLYTGVPANTNGYSYRLRTGNPVLQKENIYIAGDAAGLATTDMGEGIGPAVESGLSIARAIHTGEPVSTSAIRMRSFSPWTIIWLWMRGMALPDDPVHQ